MPTRNTFGRKQNKVYKLKMARYRKKAQRRFASTNPWNNPSFMKGGSTKITPYKAASWGPYAARVIQDQLMNPHSSLANATRGFVNKKTHNKHRHEKLKGNGEGGPVNKGKGFNTGATGVIRAQPKRSLPKWKKARQKKYAAGIVWQTVLLSKSSRLAASNNILKTFRYPIKAPECLDNERVQSMIFSPYPSAYSGIHSTYYRKVNAAGTGLDHNTAQPLDVIQHKNDIERHSLPGTTEGANFSTILYSNAATTAATTQEVANIENVHSYYDQMLNQCKLDLVFMASRCYPMRVSISVIRHIKPVAPYQWSTSDIQQLTNNLTNRGLEYTDYKVEWHHSFILGALKKGKTPPVHNIKKTVMLHAMQTNSFNDLNVSEEMGESAATQLGLGIRRRQSEVADGFVSGMCYILIKYRRVQQPTQFTYRQAINQSSDQVVSTIELPVLTDESFDVPTLTGYQVADSDGTPLSTSQGDESLGSFYLHGTLKYAWGFREDTEAVPAVISLLKANADYKKTQSLNIDPTITSDNTYGIYTSSPSHVKRVTDTSE